MEAPSQPFVPPIFRMDLSLPPSQRWTEICSVYKERLLQLQVLYDDILNLVPARFRSVARWLAEHLLRKVYSYSDNTDEVQEIRAISRETGVPIHLVVAFNTFLDLFSGCTSGAVKSPILSTMLHFRNLDWEMPPLRALLIQLEYIRDGKVVARSITYAGYIGVLTGVRIGLSISLNYRTILGSNAPIWRHRVHQAMLLVGRRPSIASRLRRVLLSPEGERPAVNIAKAISKQRSTPCYLTFCSPKQVVIVEKDLSSGVTRMSDTFLVATNHDLREEKDPDNRPVLATKDWKEEDGMTAWILGDSLERKECIVEKFRSAAGDAIDVGEVSQWLSAYPVLNELTHFSCVMDPKKGTIEWVVAHPERLSPEASFIVSDASTSATE